MAEIHVKFLRKKYKLIITDHAKTRMNRRLITLEKLIDVIESGEVKRKIQKNRYWVYEKIHDRDDNLICASIKLERPNLIVITTLIHWSPEYED